MCLGDQEIGRSSKKIKSERREHRERQDHNLLEYFYTHRVMTQHEMNSVRDHSNEIKKKYRKTQLRLTGGC